MRGFSRGFGIGPPLAAAVALACTGERANLGKLPAMEETGDRAELVYPLDQSIHPVNLPAPTLQWRRVHDGQDYFAFRFSRGTLQQSSLPEWNCGPGCFRDVATVDDDTLARLQRVVPPSGYRFFLPCGNPGTVREDSSECVYGSGDSQWAAVWADMATFNPGQALSLGLYAFSNDDTHAAVRDLGIGFAPRPVEGGFYYWSTQDKGTLRLVFGARHAESFITPGTATNPDECGGCHTVSFDGSTIAFTAGLDQPNLPEEQAADRGYLRVAPVTAPEQPTFAPDPTVHDSSMMALSPDGSRVLTAYDPDQAGPQLPRLELRDAQTGAVLNAIEELAVDDAGWPRFGYFPEFSPCGWDVAPACDPSQRQEVAITLGITNSQYGVRAGSIAILPYNDGAFGPPEVLVSDAAGDMHFYPSWSPDGRWIVFASAPAQPEDDDVHSYDRMEARLRLVARDGSQLFELDHATQHVNATSTWPKFAPFVQEDDLFFITFNTKADYGFYLRNTSLPDSMNSYRIPQLWMSAIDLRSPTADPSQPPVWLPFQRLTERNHLGYWTEQVPCRATPPLCGTDEECVDGVCQVVVR